MIITKFDTLPGSRLNGQGLHVVRISFPYFSDIFEDVKFFFSPIIYLFIYSFIFCLLNESLIVYRQIENKSWKKDTNLSYITVQKAYKFTLNIHYWYKYRRDYIIKRQRKKKEKETVKQEKPT